VFGPECFDEHGKIIPRQALAAMAAHADPARRRPGSAPPAPTGSEATYARERARKTAAEAERAELDLRARKGDLVERSAIVTTLGPAIRDLRDGILGVPRDTVLDPVQAADCESGLAALLTDFSAKLIGFAAETPPDGGPPATTA
jgi:hypothetical protein